MASGLTQSCPSPNGTRYYSTYPRLDRQEPEEPVKEDVSRDRSATERLEEASWKVFIGRTGSLRILCIPAASPTRRSAPSRKGLCNDRHRFVVARRHGG